MNPNVLIAAINAGGSIVVAITALALTYRGLNAIERRLEVMEQDLKNFYRMLGDHSTDLARLKDKTGL